MVPDAPSGPDGGDLFAAGGEAGRLMAAFDWAAHARRTGRDLAGQPALRRPHRARLAVPHGADLGAGVHPVLQRRLRALHRREAPRDRRGHPRSRWPRAGTRSARRSTHAMTTLEASWLPGLLLLLERAGYREETYFTVSHAPAFGDDGQVAGMHAVCTEVTGQILGERRQRLLHDLADGRRPARRRARRPCAAMCRALDGRRARRAVRRGLPRPAPAGPARAGSRRWAATPACCPRVGRPTRPRPGRGRRPARRHRRPLRRPGHRRRRPPADRHAGTASRSACCSPGRSPNLALDAEYRSFYELIAGQFAGAVVNIRAFEAERLRAESLAELDRAKTTFFSDVSHELRTPLTLLLGPIGDVLDDTAEPAAGRRPGAAAAGPAQRAAPAAAGQRPARLRQHRGRPGQPGARGDRRRHVHRRAGRHLPRRRRARRAAADRGLPAAGPAGLRRPADVGEGRRQPAGERGQVHVRRGHRRRACTPTTTGSC